MPNESSKRSRDIDDVIREERSRGKKHIDTEAEEERRQLRADYLRLAKEVDHEEDFLNAISALGLTPEQTQAALDAWREMKRQRR